MRFERVLIFAPCFEQRVSKQAYSFMQRNLPTTVYAETAEVSKEFENYIHGVEYIVIPVEKMTKKTPLGIKREKFIKGELQKKISNDGKTLIVSRDVVYGYIVGKLLRLFNKDKFIYLTDIADNYDLLYGSYTNIFKRVFFKIGFGFITKKAYQYSDAVYIVTEINRKRILNAYPKEMAGKKIFLLRNLPMHVTYINSLDRVKNSMVYVGRMDELSRDPFYVLDKMKELPDYSLHFFSNHKKETVEKMKAYIIEHDLQKQVFFHQRVKYDELAEAISKYQIGLVPHKRSPITDYTTPNKIYDYRISGIVTVMSDCPSLIEENSEFGFGLVYSKEKDNFVETVRLASGYKLDDSVHIPEWDKEFGKTFQEIMEM